MKKEIIDKTITLICQKATKRSIGIRPFLNGDCETISFNILNDDSYPKELSPKQHAKASFQKIKNDCKHVLNLSGIDLAAFTRIQVSYNFSMSHFPCFCIINLELKNGQSYYYSSMMHSQKASTVPIVLECSKTKLKSKQCGKSKKLLYENSAARFYAGKAAIGSLMLSIIILWQIGFRWYKIYEARSFKETSGIIVVSEKNPYRVNILYQYIVNGDTLVGGDIYADKFEVNLSLQEQFNYLQKYPINKQIVVRYSPKNPRLSLVEDTLHWGWLDFVLMISFGLIGVIFSKKLGMNLCIAILCSAFVFLLLSLILPSKKSFYIYKNGVIYETNEALGDKQYIILKQR
ncbi:hypothetical protein CHISP_3602 [Chitinispirillum alkaliphilum]|nr:hypothetical protein CHISP_3602 [Chitinispirillum alkaliphilum]